jgi:hypothetical protein
MTITQWNLSKTVENEKGGGRAIKEEEYRWGEFNQSTLCACHKYHNEALLYNYFMLMKILKIKKREDLWNFWVPEFFCRFSLIGQKFFIFVLRSDCQLMAFGWNEAKTLPCSIPGFFSRDWWYFWWGAGITGQVESLYSKMEELKMRDSDDVTISLEHQTSSKHSEEVHFSTPLMSALCLS